MELRIISRQNSEHSEHRREPSLESQRNPAVAEPGPTSEVQKRSYLSRLNPFVRHSWVDTDDFASANPVDKDPIDKDLKRAAEKHKDYPKFLNDYAHINRKPQFGLRSVFDLIVKLPPGVSEPPHPNSGQ